MRLIQPLLIATTLLASGSALPALAQTTPDAAVNNISTKGYKNVDALAADNAAITVVGTANTRYRYAPIFHRDALAFAAPPLAPVKSAVVSTTKVDPDTGILNRKHPVKNMLDSYRMINPETKDNYFSSNFAVEIPEAVPFPRLKIGDTLEIIRQQVKAA